MPPGGTDWSVTSRAAASRIPALASSPATTRKAAASSAAQSRAPRPIVWPARGDEIICADNASFSWSAKSLSRSCWQCGVSARLLGAVSSNDRNGWEAAGLHSDGGRGDRPFALRPGLAESGWTASGDQRAEADIHLASGVASICPRRTFQPIVSVAAFAEGDLISGLPSAGRARTARVAGRR